MLAPSCSRRLTMVTAAPAATSTSAAAMASKVAGVVVHDRVAADRWRGRRSRARPRPCTRGARSPPGTGRGRARQLEAAPARCRSGGDDHLVGLLARSRDRGRPACAGGRGRRGGSISSARKRVIASRSARCGADAAMRTCPPRWFVISYRCTSWPRSAAVRAASSPAGPPPMTSTFFFTGAGAGVSNAHRSSPCRRRR